MGAEVRPDEVDQHLSWVPGAGVLQKKMVGQATLNSREQKRQDMNGVIVCELSVMGRESWGWQLVY